MASEMTTSWAMLLALGAFHGINPGMGWLFAVALGMQRRSARGIWRALPPIALGHAVAVGVVVLIAGLARLAVPADSLNGLVALVLITLGLYRLWRHRHPRFGGMQVGFRDLATWSFLMATAHGAGLMVVPVFVGMSTAGEGGHTHHMAATTAGAGTALLAIVLHAVGYLAVTAFMAVLVFEKLGVGILRRAWINLDVIWAAALMATGTLTLML